MPNQISVKGRMYPLEQVRELAHIPPRSAADMSARGFDALGFVSFPRGGGALCYRSARSGAWVLVVKI
jgi:hypothetical protein